jgi:hypothetical protein
MNLQVLTGRWDDLFSCLIPCLFGDTGIEPAELKKEFLVINQLLIRSTSYPPTVDSGEFVIDN